MIDSSTSRRSTRWIAITSLVLVVAGVVFSAPPDARAQSMQHKAEPWIVSVNHRIDLNVHAQQLGTMKNGQNVRVLKPGKGRTINLASGVLIDSEGHVVTRLVNLDPRAADHDIQITTSSGSVLRARFVGFDGPTGLALLSVPELRDTKPAPNVAMSPLDDGAELRLVSTDYKLWQVTVPVERVAIYPSLLNFPARAASATLTPALVRAGVFGIVESAALTSSKDLSCVETTDGRLIGIARYVSVGRAHILSVSFLRDVVARRILAMKGSIAAGWLGADGMSLLGLPAEQRPTWAPNAGVLLREVSPKGPAELAGMRRNDLIVGFDEVVVRSTADLATSVLSTPAGTTVNVNVIREGIPMNIPAVLGGQPLMLGVPVVALPSPKRAAEVRIAQLRSQLNHEKDPAARSKIEAEILEVERAIVADGGADPTDAQFDALFDDLILGDLGLEGLALTEQLSKHFGVAGGVLISNVKSGSIGEQVGLQAADIILKAGDTLVTAEDELAEAILGAARAGRTVVEISVRRGDTTMSLPVPVGKFRRP